jgi:hypothetical protein
MRQRHPWVTAPLTVDVAIAAAVLGLSGGTVGAVVIREF